MTNQHATAVGRLVCLALLCLTFSWGTASAQNLVQTPITTNVNYAIGGYYECLPLDYKTSTKKYPLLIFIHGIGELGDGSPTQLPRILKHGVTKLINQKIMPNSFTVNGQTSSFIIISPQFRANYRDAAAVSTLIDYCVAKYRVDESRIYLTGLSMGGGISWIYAGKSSANAKRLAALLVICGNTNASSGGVTSIASTNLPVWVTHNDGDPIVPSSNSINWQKGLNGYSPAINPKTILNLFHSDVHDAWSKTYDLNFKPNGVNVFEWLLMHKRATTTTANEAPKAVAGSDQVITLPTNSIKMSGSGSDADGSISSYKWTQVSGPSSASISSSNTAATTMSALVQGTYVFRLTVTDNQGASASDDLKVTVNAAPNQVPVAAAGSDQSITLPVNNVTLHGSGTDIDGTIISYKWSQVSGPSSAEISAPTTASTNAGGLLQGTYVFRLTVSDNQGAVATDDVKITVNAAPNEAPVAHAGSNQNLTLPLNSATLQGSGTDSDGTIVSYAWAKVSGPAGGTINMPGSATTTITALQQGSYVYRLTVTDDNAATATDEVTVNVASAPNQAPTADAGTDKTIALPASSITLSGTGNDADGLLTSFTWTKISGPESGNILDATAATTTIGGLVEGTYSFRLTVTDDDGASASDDVQVTVNAIPNGAPVANAGTDLIITLPDNTVSISGEGSDLDGSIASYLWTKVSGPDGGIIDNKTLPQILITAMQQGTYVYRLTVTDNKGATATDDVQIIVNAEKPGVAKAGNDTLIYKNQTRPDTVVLNGMASVGGSKYVWTKMSGPGTTVIEDTAAQATYAIGLEEGTHIFKLSIDGKTSDEIKVVVRDWQKKNVSPCRPGGGKSFIVPESYPGQYNRLYINRDNLLGEKVMGGDTLYFKGGKYTAFEIGDFGGGEGCPVYLMPKDEALVITDGYFRIGVKDSNVVQHAVLDGTVLRSKGIPYGFFIDNRNVPDAENNYSGLVAGWVSDFTVKGYHSIKTGIMQIKLDAKEVPYGRYDKFIQKRIKIQDNFIDGSTAEGMYIGNTASNGGQLNNPYGPPPRMDSVEITDNIVMNCGWDGIQLTNARTAAVIRHNIVYKPGLQNQPSQRAGILMGGNTTGIIDSNIVFNSRGNGIQVFGYGAVKVHSNIIDSIYGGTGDQDGMYQSHIAVLPEDFNIPLSVNNFGNLISRVERKGIRIANNSGTMIPGHTYYNTFINPVETDATNLINANANDAVDNNHVFPSFPIQVNEITTKKGTAYLSITQGDATETFSNVKDAVDWLFGRLNGITANNEPPVANAGTDKTITLPEDSVTVSGSGADLDGSIVNYQWKQLSGPTDANVLTATEAKTNITRLSEGVYTFELTVTDNGKKAGKDTMRITVNAAIIPLVNRAPDVFAGNNVRITLPENSVDLKGSATDEDGTVTETKWTKISGPDAYQIAIDTSLQTTVDSLTEGVYLFELRAVDNQQAAAADTIKITVVAETIVTPQNKVPVADAGPDQTIQLPANTVTLKGKGTDADGKIETYHWQKLSGPANAVIKNANDATTTVSGLAKGIYLFELTVADNMGATKADTIQVTVLPKPNVKPTANAGADQTIQLPENATILNGSGADEDGSITSYKWKQVSGPATASLTRDTTAQAPLRNLKAGAYVFQLAVTDNNGAIATDSVKLVVKAAAVIPNKAPVAYAGNDLIVQLPENTVVLSGSGLDEDGTIKSYQWQQVSGPATATFKTPKDAQTITSGLVKGSYTFEIKVTDDKGASDADTVLVTVKAAVVVPNKAPVVHAGSDVVITLPVNKITVTGSATDGDGAIASVLWTKISGLAQYTITAPQALQTTITNLAKGVYTFELKATDNKGAISRDTIQVTVEPAVTRPMFVMDAGQDQVITLPTDSVDLQGTVDDPYKTVKKFSWRKIKGPNTFKFSTTAASKTHVTGLKQGVYLFECKATDVNGNTLSDTVQVTVNMLEKSSATIYPNPATTVANIRIESNTRTTNTLLVVYDINGRIMHQEEFKRTGGKMIKKLDVSKLPTGIYTVQVGTDINHQTTLKLIKQ